MNDHFSVDLISDLNLTDASKFEWTGKPTSLFCVVAGNISDDLEVLQIALTKLSDAYRTVLFIDGSLEHVHLEDYEQRVAALKELCDNIPNVVYLHNHVVILNNIAFVGSNGWYGNRKEISQAEDIDYLDQYRSDDLAYLSHTVKSLQTHRDVEKIIMVTNSIPSDYLAFNSPNVDLPPELNPATSLLFDHKNKITKWLFGTNDITVDVTLNDRQYVNNPVVSGLLYWPKKISL